MTNIADITPAYEPVSMARGMVDRAPSATAGVCVLVNENGELWFDMCGHQKKDILWALHKMIHELMEEDS